MIRRRARVSALLSATLAARKANPGFYRPGDLALGRLCNGSIGSSESFRFVIAAAC